MSIEINKCERVFKALLDITRLNILKELSKKDSVCICNLVKCFNIQQSKLSYHLKMLLDLELIIMERHGKWNYYSININQLEKYLSNELILDILEKR